MFGFGRIRQWWRDLKIRYTNEVLDQSYDAREERLGQLLAEAQAIAKLEAVLHQIPGLGLERAYLATRGVVFLPYVGEGGELVFTPVEPQAKPPEKALAILPFTREDAGLGQQAKLIHKGEIVVTYDSIGHNLVVNLSSGETDRFAACALWREVARARLTDQAGCVGKSSRERGELEVLQLDLQLWSLDHRLAMAIGGQGFFMCMQPDVLEVAGDLAKGAKPGEFRPRGGSVLDLCYGQVQDRDKSEALLQRRQLMHSIFAQMAGLQLYFGPEVAYGHCLNIMAWLRQEGQKRKDEILGS